LRTPISAESWRRRKRLERSYYLPQSELRHVAQCFGLIRNAGIEPTVIEYLKAPPDRQTLLGLIERMGIRVRELLRRKGSPYDELGLDDPKWTDDQLIDAMLANAILINRPIVVTPLGVKLCRPSQTVLEILPAPQRGAFTKEDGERVAVDQGRPTRGPNR
jgi:arsenate reductase